MARAKRNTENVDTAPVGGVVSEGSPVGGASATSEGLPTGVVRKEVNLGTLYTFAGEIKGTFPVVNGLNVIEFKSSEGSPSVLIGGFSLDVVGIFRSWLRRLRLVHLNGKKEAVILYEFENSVGRNDRVRFFDKDISLGCFEFSAVDTLVLEVDLSEVMEGYTLQYGFNVFSSTSERPHYLKVKEFLLGGGEKVILNRDDFDYLNLSHHTSNSSFLLNSVPVYYNNVLSGGGFFIHKEDLPSVVEVQNRYSVEDIKNFESRSSSVSGFSSFFAVKKVYNKDTFSSYQEQLKTMYAVVENGLRRDYVNTMYKIFLGEYPKLDDLRLQVEALAQMHFNERSKGYYDTYTIPVASVDTDPEENVERVQTEFDE